MTDQPPDFLPEYTSVPIGTGGLCKPAHRLFTGQRLTIVPGSQPYDSVVRAAAAAKEYVRQKLNPPITGERCDPEPDILGIEDWRRKNREQSDAERNRVFGQAQPSVIHRNGRDIKVERRKRA